MALSLRQVRARVRSVENIKKITRAMEMVSSSKLRTLEKELLSFKEYFLRMEAILNNLLASCKEVRHPLLQQKLNKQKLLLCVIASDTGLCGSYNSNIFHAVEEFRRNNELYDISFIAIGKKALANLNKTGLTIIDSYTELYGRYSEDVAEKIARNLIDKFLSGRADEVYIGYTNFVSASRCRPAIEKVLSLDKREGKAIDYLLEPDIEDILEELIPLFIKTKIKNILLSAFTAENAIRVMAMHEATDNAKELLDASIMLRNKMRQANITTEITEVISSVNALKG